MYNAIKHLRKGHLDEIETRQKRQIEVDFVQKCGDSVVQAKIEKIKSVRPLRRLLRRITSARSFMGISAYRPVQSAF